MDDKEIAIKVEGLGKRYRLGRNVIKPKSFGGKVKQALTSPFEWLLEQNREPRKDEVFWALKDINFEIARGEVVGFIGHNGAGKSTLLKILSRITEPTTGYAEINGRLAALLEVGTGMHPELTGRENIYMNGTVLGMKKREIDAKFDEIVDFSGVSKFLDTPVKHYSSGMRVRLGFAIAAHLEPEILVVDEVLAVGDADFQAKCLNKMETVAKGGRTVLFVSHNLSAVQTLCKKAFLLLNGKLIEQGTPQSIINTYLSEKSGTDRNRLPIIRNTNRSGTKDVEFLDFWFENLNQIKISKASLGDDIFFVFKVKINTKNAKNVNVGFSIHSNLGDTLSVLYSAYQNIYWDFSDSNIVSIRFLLKNINYAPGQIEVRGRIMVSGIESDWPKFPLGHLTLELNSFFSEKNLIIPTHGALLIKGIWTID